jgi:quercetin dioxygenase-like cupin family protein
MKRIAFGIAGQFHLAGNDSLFPSPGTPGEGWVRVRAVDAIRQTNLNGKSPHPNLLPEYREKEKCALALVPLVLTMFLVVGCSSSKPPQPAAVQESQPILADIVGAPATRPALVSQVFSFPDLPIKSAKFGEQRQVLRSPTATLDELEVHITTLQPGQRAHLPHRHPHEEMMMLKEGTLEATVNDRTIPMSVGSILFVAPNDLHGLLNVGTTPATYFVITWRTPRTGPATKPVTSGNTQSAQ